MSRPVELPGVWGELAELAGSATRLAEILECTPRTIQRWAKRKVEPSTLTRRAVNHAVEARGWPRPFKG